MVRSDQATMPVASRRGRSVLSASKPTGTSATAYSTCTQNKGFVLDSGINLTSLLACGIPRAGADVLEKSMHHWAKTKKLQSHSKSAYVTTIVVQYVTTNISLAIVLTSSAIKPRNKAMAP